MTAQFRKTGFTKVALEFVGKLLDVYDVIIDIRFNILNSVEQITLQSVIALAPLILEIGSKCLSPIETR